MEDSIGLAHMTQGSSSVTFSPDRFGTLNSAINLEESYKMTPSTSLNNLTFSELPSNYESKLNNTFTRINSLIIVVKKTN